VRADLVVIGGGLAALTAARSLQQSGRQVTLVWPGLTSMYFCFPSLDVLGYRDGQASDPVEEPLSALPGLIKDRPDHPYARAGLPAIQQAVRLLLAFLRDSGMVWEGSLSRNLVLPTALGVPKPTCIAPASMTHGDLRRLDPIALCGFDGYQDFTPELAAGNLSRLWPGGREPVHSVRVALPGVDQGRLFTSIDLARWMQGERFRKEVAGRLRQAVRAAAGDEPSLRIGVPAVLGLDQAEATYAAFEAEVERPVFEIPTIPPSVAAMRVFDRLRRQLQSTGVELISGVPVHRAELEGTRCSRVWLKSPGAERPLEARAFVLALEDRVDGAVRAGPLLDRDPFFGAVLARYREPRERAAESLLEAQPFNSVGFEVTSRLQPARADGAPLADNVFVAGGLMRGYDPTVTKSRGGQSIATAFRAAQEALAA
jgi:glycerol-3-phosphate dehydrogenase subunit B